MGIAFVPEEVFYSSMIYCELQCCGGRWELCAGSPGFHPGGHCGLSPAVSESMAPPGYSLQGRRMRRLSMIACGNPAASAASLWPSDIAWDTWSCLAHAGKLAGPNAVLSSFVRGAIDQQCRRCHGTQVSSLPQLLHMNCSPYVLTTSWDISASGAAGAEQRRSRQAQTARPCA